ncbi:MAG TPA: toll/interleukin-1 receptor domain-containing protein [Blastocatellia bacterium]|nr:toll/interleukin-1 receptor domain-containing protein [Blastocatellia bacterium]
MKHDVYISHSHSLNDRTIADAICAGFEERGMRCLTAHRDIPFGRDWGEMIGDAISGCRVIVVIISSNANGSGLVLREVNQAAARNKIVIPFRVENVKLSESLKFRISTMHWIDALTPPLEPHIHRLVDLVSGLWGKGDSPRVEKPAQSYITFDTSLPRLEITRTSDYQLSPQQINRQIFISHVEEDGAVALELARGLEAEGYSTWYYERDSIPAISYLDQIDEAIEQSQAMLVVISLHSLGSWQVDKEVIRAHECGKHFVPVLCDVKHAEFQTRKRGWRLAMGATTSVAIKADGASAILPRIITGLKAVGVKPVAPRSPQG